MDNGESRLGDDLVQDKPRLAFGPFELRLDTQELYKHGIRVRLQGKPFQVLRALLQEPGQLVTRDELRNKLWPSGTFVDFESGLNTAVNRLRCALGDSAENPVYIETLSRFGYRFIAPVKMIPAATVGAPDAENVLQSVQMPPDTSPAFSARSTLSKPWKGSAVVGLLSVFLLTAVLLRTTFSQPAVSFHQLTFLRGFVGNARFVSGRKQIIYSAGWNGEPSHVFLASTSGSSVQKLFPGNASLESISNTGKIALFERNDTHEMLLATESLQERKPHILFNEALGADWGLNDTLCVLSHNGSTYSVQYPPGHTLYTSNNWLGDLRVSPKGDQIAFLEHPIAGDDAGRVVVVNSAGVSKVLSSGWASAAGLAWHPSKREVWFTAAQSGVNRMLIAVDLSGHHTRQIAQVPGGMELLDIASDGSVLITRSTPQMMMLYGTLGGSFPQNISYRDWSRAVAISADGRTVLFDESGEAGGKHYGTYLQDIENRSSERLGDGRAIDLSPDARWVLMQAADDTSKLVLYSTKDHKVVPVRNHGFQYVWAKFLPNMGCPEILFEGSLPGQKTQIYRQQLPGETPALVNADSQLKYAIIDPTGSLAAGCTDKSTIAVIDIAHGAARQIQTPRLALPVAFVNQHELITSNPGKEFLDLQLLNTETREMRPYGRIPVPDPVGSQISFPLSFASNLHTFVYSRLQTLSTLYSVTGWR